MPLSRDDIAAACRANDERADSGTELPVILMNLGVQPQGAVYVAEQRALRVALMFEGWTRTELALMAQGMAPRKVKLSPEQVAYIPVYSGIWLDGLAAALKAVHNQQE